MRIELRPPLETNMTWQFENLYGYDTPPLQIKHVLVLRTNIVGSDYMNITSFVFVTELF